ncbi:MAG: hypothetical protein ACLQHK_11030 [Gallionellaceae bacterium]
MGIIMEAIIIMTVVVAATNKALPGTELPAIFRLLRNGFDAASHSHRQAMHQSAKNCIVVTYSPVWSVAVSEGYLAFMRQHLPSC